MSLIFKSNIELKKKLTKTLKRKSPISFNYNLVENFIVTIRLAYPLS